jgi:DNA-binding beta-propeller fold protein YncE
MAVPAAQFQRWVQQVCSGIQRNRSAARQSEYRLRWGFQVVQFFLKKWPYNLFVLLLAPILLFVGVSRPLAADQKSKKNQPAEAPRVPDLLLEGGRKLTYERSFSWEREVKPKRGFWSKLVDAVAGAPEFHTMVRPYSVVADSRGRIIVTDPGVAGIHVFDFEQQKYKFISRSTKGKDSLKSPQCVAVDGKDNIYVTDSDTGRIFVFDEKGKYLRMIGALKYGEGFFKRPTGIAIDSAAQRIYVSDTYRDKIYVMDMSGSVMRIIGKPGTGDGEFNFPTELRLHGDDLIVVDAMNFRVQVLDKPGNFEFSLGKIGDSSGTMFRPKGIGVDSEGHFYVVDGLWGVVQVFNRRAQLLYYFGRHGTGFGSFQMPAGLFVDGKDFVYVVDSFNRRVQVFHYFGLAGESARGVQ